MTYRSDIDGLRAIAVLLVLVFHFDLLGLGEGGFIGVDIFFVISGFLISTICWRDLERGRFSLKDFYVRRIRRLAPALFVVQIMALIFGAVTLLPIEFNGLAKESFFVQSYLSNFYYWRTVNYFGLQSSSAYMIHCWSLAVEEQFYLLFPIFLLLVHRYFPRHLLPALLALVLLSFGLNIALVGSKPEATFYLLPTRAWELALGALIPFILPYFEKRAILREWAAPIGAALLIAALGLHNAAIPFPGWFALLPTLASVGFIVSGAGTGSATSRALSHPVPVFFGKISYPLYLVHWPVHIFAGKLLPAYDLPERFTMFVLSIVLAWLIFRFVERPVRSGQVLAKDRVTVLAYAGATGIILSGVSAIVLSQGWPARFSPEVVRIASYATDADPHEVTTDFVAGTPIEAAFQRIGAPSVKPSWLIVGDSHAGALTEAFNQFLQKRGEAGVIAHASSCMPLLGVGARRCREFSEKSLDFLRANRELQNVVLISIWRQPMEHNFLDQQFRIAQGKAAWASFDRALGDTLAAIRQSGAHAVFWDPLPAMPTSVPETLARNIAFGLDRPVSISRAAHEAQFVYVNKALDAKQALIARRIPSANALCDAQTCTGVANGEPILRDNNHLAYSQSGRMARFLEQALANFRSVPRGGDSVVLPQTPRE